MVEKCVGHEGCIHGMYIVCCETFIGRMTADRFGDWCSPVIVVSDISGLKVLFLALRTIINILKTVLSSTKFSFEQEQTLRIMAKLLIDKGAG